MKTIELTPLRRKSFYGKAVMIKDKEVYKLKSYETIVATFNPETKELKINGWYSATTARHINAFLDYFGLPTMNKSQMENY